MRRGGHHADRCEILDRVPGELVEQALVGDERDGVQHQRVAVGFRARRRFHADVAGSPRAVLDVDLPVQRLGERLGDEPRGDVHAAPGRERRDQLDRLAGIGLRGERRAGREQRKRNERAQDSHADVM